MVKLRSSKDFKPPTLNGCINLYKIMHEKYSNGRYFSKYMVKHVIDQYNLKISEIEYFSLVKSYLGVIDIDEPEDNLIEVHNKKILQNFP